ncbi:hypothetical protein [Mechercharimyces sp. CAU 1602]|uniref:hypothetical protein n=1 Tax=Mechercharimyces sp. CAU 1602 TaxID=2973933 RepID=UPI0021629CF1|nr:hypothetical protein [Mechercharimyces sp. CAU 1602]MCS1350097.1 hypothetical protein [Mechercharimyces sp. CAU 1602]
MKGRMWTKEEDQLLADTVLDYIRDGKTQLDAFAFLSKELGRTAGACAFRWNAVVRQLVMRDFKKAKKDSIMNELKKKRVASSHSLKSIMKDLYQVEEKREDMQYRVQKLENKVKEKEERLRQLATENQQLKEHCEAIELYNQVKERYAGILQLLESASGLKPEKESYADKDASDYFSSKPDESKTSVDTETDAQS